MTATKFLDNVSDKDIEIEPEPEPRPKSRCPDGGWGWVIVLGAFLCNVIVDGVCFTFGIFVEDIMTHYGGDHSNSALVGSLLVGCYLLAGPIVGALANKFGCRKVTMCGSVLTCIAFLASTNAPSIEVLIVLYGVVGGIGLGLIYLPAIVIIGYWFERKRAFATGIALCGSGIGTLIFAPINKTLLEEYSWKQSLVIVAGIILNCAICGALFRPMESNDNKKRMKRGVVTRGSIMKALIAEKERQRTISNGSLDNCIITKDNRLIKIDKIDLRNKSTSYINRLKQQLGFSSGSLNRSKNSLIITPVGRNNTMIINIVESRPSTPVQEKKLSPTPVRSTRRKRDYERRRDSGCGSLESPKKQYDMVPMEDPLEVIAAEEAELMRRGSLNSRQAAEESGNLLNPSQLKDTRYLTRSSTSLRSKSDHSGLLAPTSIMTLSSSVRFGEVTIDEIEDYESRRELPGWCLYITEMFDLRLLKNKAFVLYAFASFFSMLGFFIPYFFIPMKMSKMDTDSDNKNDAGTFIIAIIGLSSTIGRLIFGWIADRPWVNTYYIHNASLVLAGVVTIICPFFTDSTQMTMFAIGFGFFTAAFLSLRSIILVDLVGLDRLTSSFGLLIMFQGAASIAGSPFAGWIMDHTSIDSVFYMSGALLALAGLLGCPLQALRRQYQEEDRDEEMFDYPMNSELEMIEQVKLPETVM